MVTPPSLKSGDTIAIAAPARKISYDELAPALALFESWDLKVKLSPNVYSIDHQYAGTDEQRFSDLQMLLDDTTVKAIFCARGGYGLIRIIDKLDFTIFKEHPKWLIGYSDITILHSHIHSKLGIESIHATMPINYNPEIEATTQSMSALKEVLFGSTPEYRVKPNGLNKTGQSRGPIIGGNLSILYSLIGSDSDVDTVGKILFIEDIDEYLYHIDRMMLSLKRASKLDNLAGLIVGGFTKMRDNDIPFGKHAWEIIYEHVKDYKYPVIFDFPSGHTPLNLPLIMGREVHIEVSSYSESMVKFLQPTHSKYQNLKNIIKPTLFIVSGFLVLYLIYWLLLNL